MPPAQWRVLHLSKRADPRGAPARELHRQFGGFVTAGKCYRGNLRANRIRAVHGVKSTETFIYLDLVKQTFTWGAH